MLKLKTSINNSYKISALIFDLDGTLVDSNLNFSEIKSQLGCPEEVDLLEYVERLPLKLKQEAIDYIQSHELADAKTSRWLPWAKEFVSNIKAINIPMAIVTRNYSSAAALKVKNNEIPIDLIITREDAPPKPNPTALLDIAKSWVINPNEILYVGDYLYDVQAAINANMHSCLYSPSAQQDYQHLASINVECLSELWSHLSEDH